MAVTTKTLTPTNQTVTLPDMTERPDASVLVTDIGRNTDAINAISKNDTTASATDISSYGASNQFTAPYDGFVYLQNDSGQSATIYIRGSSGAVFGAIGGTQGRYMCYVRKGMKASVSGTAAAASYREFI